MYRSMELSAGQRRFSVSKINDNNNNDIDNGTSSNGEKCEKSGLNT